MIGKESTAHAFPYVGLRAFSSRVSTSNPLRRNDRNPTNRLHVRQGMLVDDPPGVGNIWGQLGQDHQRVPSEQDGRTSPYSSKGTAVFTVARWKAHKKWVEEYCL